MGYRRSGDLPGDDSEYPFFHRSVPVSQTSFTQYHHMQRCRINNNSLVRNIQGN